MENSEAIASILELYLAQIDSDYNEVNAALNAFENEVVAFIDSPSESGLSRVRSSWIRANSSYELTSIHRYFADTVLPDDLALEFFEVQYQLNHWPVLPGYLDYVTGYPDSGIVNDMTIVLESTNLKEQHGTFDINEASVGFHAVEFLIWGENPDGATPRSYSDFLPQQELTAQQETDGMEVSDLSNNRRRQLLLISAQILREDFRNLMSLWSEGVTQIRVQLSGISGGNLLTGVLDAITSLLTEELLVRSLYPMLNGDFSESLPSPFSRSSQNAVSAHLVSLEKLLLDIGAGEGTNLDSLLTGLSGGYGEFFFQNFDASKECLVVLYSGEFVEASLDPTDVEFKVVECINFLINMIDYLEQIKSGLINTA